MGTVFGSFRREIPVTHPNTTNQTRRLTNPYRYPPADGGAYFSSHYHLGHRKFETGEPELFLFGELSDLNFLPSKPISFPYKQPPKNQPVRTLRSYINMQRDSFRLIKCEGSDDSYYVRFTFDSDVDCCFTVFTKLPDTVQLESLRNGSYSGGEGETVSRPFHYASGTEQQFEEPSYTITPSDFGDENLNYDPENDQTCFPVIILMETDDPQASESQHQAQMSICILEKSAGNGYIIKVLKQKLMVDGVEYLLQEIYGLENKAPDKEPVHHRHDGSSDNEEEGEEDSDSDDDLDAVERLGAECVICITEVRDTLLLPCRHLCLCNSCAASLRYQSSNCPVCRAPFRALLQVQALQPLDPDKIIDEDEMTGNPKYATAGYQCVPLLQALNGYNLDDTSKDTGPRAVSMPSSPLKEDEKNGEDGPSESTKPSTDDTTEFCVVPIENECESPPFQPIELPVRTLLTSSTSTGNRQKVYEIDEQNIPLPGTPSSDHFTVQVHSGSQCQGESGCHGNCQDPPQIALSMDDSNASGDHNDVITHVPASPSGSDNSSRSTKSTDILLPLEQKN